MGAAIATLRDTIVAGDKQNKQELAEQLTFLISMANAKLDKYQADLESMFMTENPKTSRRGGIPGYRALRWERAYNVTIEKDSKVLQTKIGGIIDSFFGAKDPKTGESEFNIQEGFKTLVSGALDVFLGNGRAGEHEEQKYFIFMQHNAIIRIDVKLWRYNFVTQKVMGEQENVVAYIFCTSVVDHNNLQDDELLFLLSEYAGDHKMSDYLGKLVGMWTLIKSVTDEAKDPKTAPKFIPEKKTPAPIEAPSAPAVIAGVPDKSAQNGHDAAASPAQH
ncbi:hypothetical protein CALCODRAFT_150977 [Calocera cornea HHB12733]|uniref:Uncharacterized protein n=1 Tax=Calocera cornea HHB12733 TaxID=1353952 RepID=A0A165I4Y7_9BASI|nr:hypothetical protein CALCODRAFT_150977 [Calocera cornea HHB12733]